MMEEHACRVKVTEKELACLSGHPFYKPSILKIISRPAKPGRIGMINHLDWQTKGFIKQLFLISQSIQNL